MHASGSGHSGISLLAGWLPTTAQTVAAVVVIAAFAMMMLGGHRSRPSARAGMTYMVLAAGAGAGVDWQLSWGLADQGLASDPAPTRLWVWIGALSAAVMLTALTWRRIRWAGRCAGVAGICAALLGAGLAVNLWVGYFPTVQQAWSQLTASPLPDEVAPGQLPSLLTTQVSSGKVVAITTPDTLSHLPHRTEYVYLPPAWFTGDRAALPVLMMIGGEFSTPTDWIRTGDAVHIADAYASSHAGRAPILVFADSTGSFRNDTECVNGPRGNAATHLTDELRPYVISHFGAAESPAQWGVIGWSTGGTCAIDLAVTHPELFSTFEDIQGDLSPNAGEVPQTIARLYGGNPQAWAAFDPLTVLAHHARYPDSAGWFDNSPPTSQRTGDRVRSTRAASNSNDDPRAGFGGRGDPAPAWMQGKQAAEAHSLCTAATARGITCTLHIHPGRHTWQFASHAFTTALPWLTQHLTAAPADTEGPRTIGHTPPLPAGTTPTLASNAAPTTTTT